MTEDDADSDPDPDPDPDPEPERERVTRPYKPPRDLQEDLFELAEEMTTTYGEATTVELQYGHEAVQRPYAVSHEGLRLTGKETTSPVGSIVSLGGHFGFAATAMLVTALELGECSQIHTDEFPPPRRDQYQTIVAAWFTEEGVRAGLPAVRVDDHGDTEIADDVSSADLERFARTWTADDEPGPPGSGPGGPGPRR